MLKFSHAVTMGRSQGQCQSGAAEARSAAVHDTSHEPRACTPPCERCQAWAGMPILKAYSYHITPCRQARRVGDGGRR